MFSEAELLPISGLQHLVFCKRQCALIHVEQQWAENRFTSEGRVLHEKAHSNEIEARDGVHISRSIPLRSLEYGLVGIADVVEFHRLFPDQTEGVLLPGVSGSWIPYPVEYKRGRKKKDSCDEVQLCAQALCLEEMLGVTVSEGALYYGKTRRRTVVPIDRQLREETLRLVREFRELVIQGVTPEASEGPKCEHCSLRDICLPQVRTSPRSMSRYLNSFFDEEVEGE